MSWASRRERARLQIGFTLIDLLVMIVLLGLVGSAMTVLFTRLAAQSSDILRARQALAVAQALINEVRMMPFTYCDPQDANATLALGAYLGAQGCSTTVEALGPEPFETRTSATNRFDNVNDYNNWVQPGPSCPAGLCDLSGNLLNGPGSPLQGCSTRVNTTPQALPGITALDAYGRPQSLLISVQVRCPNLFDTVLNSIRVRHAPNRR